MRLFSFKRWRARELFAWWLIYWLVLIVAGLGPGMLAIWRATRVPTSDSANVNLNVSNTLLSLTVSRFGRTTYAGSMHVLAFVLLVAGPPLLAWIAWAATRRRGEGVRKVV
jgi:hypothetical protein